MKRPLLALVALVALGSCVLCCLAGCFEVDEVKARRVLEAQGMTDVRIGGRPARRLMHPLLALLLIFLGIEVVRLIAG